MTRPRRRPWQTLLWTGVGFIALQLGLGLLIETRLRGVRDPEFAAKEASLRARLAESPGKPLVLVLGSSRPLLGVQAGRLQQELQPDGLVVFNFGIPACGPLRHSVALQRLLDAGLRPDFLMVEVLLPMLNDNHGSSLEESWLESARLDLGEIRRVWADHGRPTRLLRSWAYGRLLPCLRHPSGFRQEFGVDQPTPGCPNETDSDDHGWLGLFPQGISPNERRRRTELARRQYSGSFHEFRLARPAARALEGLLERCRREHIPVALLLMPEGSAFRGWYPPGMAAGCEAYVKDLSRRNGVPLVDARTWVDDHGFFDSHHLLPAGAEQFTDRLGREALRPLVLPALRDRARRLASSPP